MELLELIGRDAPLFEDDLDRFEISICEIIKNSRFLVIGGAGSIGQAVTREIFSRNPAALHIVDLSENNLAELVRDIRSTLGYIKGDFKTMAIDCGGHVFNAFLNNNLNYDFILNLSAMKHVRSERDPFTLMRMIEVNTLNTITTLEQAKQQNVKKYFCVSTDKATNPVNMMGASKRIMEMFLMRDSQSISISTARFANVAFSDGSLLHSFKQRFEKKQPIAAPNDILRYFMTPAEAGQLCLLSCLLGENRDVFFPKVSEQLGLTSFQKIAERFLTSKGYEPRLCETETEASASAKALISKNLWPCVFAASNTTGEKAFEEFHTDQDVLDLDRFDDIGVVKPELEYHPELLELFLADIKKLREGSAYTRKTMVDIFQRLVPNFKHREMNQHLDDKM